MKNTLATLSLLCFTLAGCGQPASTGAETPATHDAPKPAKAVPAASEVLVSGTIELGTGAISDKATAVYVSLRGGPGPPLAAKKLENGPYPMAFEITTADRPMRSGQPIPDALTLKVALDGDGNPMTKDGLGEVVVEVKKGTTGQTYTVVAPVPPAPK